MVLLSFLLKLNWMALTFEFSRSIQPHSWDKRWGNSNYSNHDAGFLTIEAMVGDYHIYRDSWRAIIKKELTCEKKSGNFANPFLWKVKELIEKQTFYMTLLLSLLAFTAYLNSASNFFFPSTFVNAGRKRAVQILIFI